MALPLARQRPSLVGSPRERRRSPDGECFGDLSAVGGVKTTDDAFGLFDRCELFEPGCESAA